MLTLTQPESMTITWEVSSPARHSTAPGRKTSSTPAAASASRSGSASEFQKLRAVGRSQRTLAAATGISGTWPAPGSDPSSRLTVSPSLKPDSPCLPGPVDPPCVASVTLVYA